MRLFRILLIIVLFAGALMLIPGTHAQTPLRILHVVNGTLGDQSFFDSAQAGLERAVEELGITLRTVELSGDRARWETGLDDAMANADEYDILVVGGSEIADYFMARADLYPDRRFIFHDEPIDFERCACTNVYNVIYAQNEGSYLAGVYVAAMMRDSALPGISGRNTIGAVGGIDIPVINDFIVGYVQGARAINPDIQTLIQYVGGDNPWFDPARGFEIGSAMFEQGADFVFSIAGGTWRGVAEAARSQRRYVIGVDSDVWLLIHETEPELAERIPTSMVKNVGNALFRALELEMSGELPFGTTEIVGIREGAIGLARNDYYEAITPDSVRETVEQAEADVINCRVLVDTMLAPRPCTPPEAVSGD